MGPGMKSDYVPLYSVLSLKFIVSSIMNPGLPFTSSNILLITRVRLFFA
jgi:hypothetical protein